MPVGAVAPFDFRGLRAGPLHPGAERADFPRVNPSMRMFLPIFGSIFLLVPVVVFLAAALSLLLVVTGQDPTGQDGRSARRFGDRPFRRSPVRGTPAPTAPTAT